ncbi:hypothetical protein LBMAG53_37270 [Planctomycetota bacterium]|nr:hypothetical protein LBMAG53_37270 [Planctomycetota bacterium]
MLSKHESPTVPNLPIIGEPSPTGVVGRLGADGISGLLSSCYALHLDATLRVAMPGDEPAQIELAGGTVMSARWQERAGIEVLASCSRQALGGFGLSPRAYAVTNELCLLTPALLAEVKSALALGVGAGGTRKLARDALGLPIPAAGTTVQDLVAEARLTTRVRSDNANKATWNASGEFPPDFISALVPDEFRSDEPEEGQPAPSEPDWVEPTIGYMLGKCYLSAELGRGATAIVYRAMHLSLKVDVAVKVFRPAEGRESLLSRREAPILARLSHPNILRVLDCNDELPYAHLVMEYVEGMTLRELINNSGRLAPPKAIDYCLQAARGLDCAARSGVVHCDVKPANFLVNRDNQLKISDFGVARVGMDDQVNRGRAVVGTPAYIAPEVVTHGIERASAASDLYSLGATLFHCLAGRPPFTAEDPIQQMAEHVRAPAPPLRLFAPEAGDALGAIVARLLDKDSTQRGDYAQLIEDLEGLDLESSDQPRTGPIFATLTTAWRRVRNAVDGLLSRGGDAQR